MIFNRPAAIIAIRAISTALAAEIADISGTIDALVTAPTLASSGENLNGTSVFSNYINAVKDGQFFWKKKVSLQYEKPGSDIVEFDLLRWCGKLHFTDVGVEDSPIIIGGLTGSCLTAFLSGLDEAVEAGAQLVFEQVQEKFVIDGGISAVYVPQTNVFEGQYHPNTDNHVNRLWDDGRQSMGGMIAWEVHDEGDLSPNAGSSAFPGIAEWDWISAEEAAGLLGLPASELTPDTFEDVYANTWVKTHEEESEVINPNSLAIVEEAKEDLGTDEADADEQLAVEVPDIGDIDAQVLATSLPAPGTNLDGNSVFRNFFDAFQNGQFFWKETARLRFEKPGSDIVEAEALTWCGNLHFPTLKEGAPIGFTGNCVLALLSGLDAIAEAGGHASYEQVEKKFVADHGVSAIYVPQTNVFEGQWHAGTDNYVYRFWDDGRSSMRGIGWEVHDEGDIDPQMATSSFSGILKLDWISVAEAAAIMKLNESELTPERFEEAYAKIWIKTHEEEAAVSNPNPEAELAIIEEIKDDLGIDTNADEAEEEMAADDTENNTEENDNVADADSSDAVGGRKIADNTPDASTTSALEITDIGELDALVTATSLAAPGKNLGGGNVFQNFIDAYNNSQFFLKASSPAQYEKPGSDIVVHDELLWCSNMHFTNLDEGSPIGFTGNCVRASQAGARAVEAGAQLAFEQVQEQFVLDGGISAVYVPQTNIFEGQWHTNTDNFVFRWWDDGRQSMGGIGWEVHDEGDLGPNAGTSAWSAIAELNWISVAEAADIIGLPETDLTPEAFDEVYANTWVKTHEHEAAVSNPNPGPEQEAVDQIKEDLTNETSVDDAKDEGTSDGAREGRKLVKIAVVMSASLLLFGF
ncbi:hypothetical protein ACHAWF_008223 [Thalassiosira exigua]